MPATVPIFLLFSVSALMSKTHSGASQGEASLPVLMSKMCKSTCAIDNCQACIDGVRFTHSGASQAKAPFPALTFNTHSGASQGEASLPVLMPNKCKSTLPQKMLVKLVLCHFKSTCMVDKTHLRYTKSCQADLKTQPYTASCCQMHTSSPGQERYICCEWRLHVNTQNQVGQNHGSRVMGSIFLPVYTPLTPLIGQCNAFYQQGYSTSDNTD